MLLMLVVSGEGVSVRLIDYYRVMNNQELSLLRQQLSELRKKETTVGDVMAAKMAWFEFPAPIGPVCGRLKLEPPSAKQCEFGETSGTGCGREERTVRERSGKAEPDRTDPKELFAEDERNPAVRAHTELVFAEVTVAPDAKPGRREIRVITKRGISNALPFYVGQVPEVARKPMKTAKKPVLGKEYLAQRKRPPEEEEMRITVPCTMNGQIAAGEVNRYRFPASKGQRLLISAKARQLVPYVADGVPGWFQAVLRLHDSNGKELAYNDDFRFDPDPVLFYEVPEDGEYRAHHQRGAVSRPREFYVSDYHR